MPVLKYRPDESAPWEVVGVPTEVKGMTMDLLWENPNPNAAFAAQTVELDLSGYEKVGIRYGYNNIRSANYAEVFVGGGTVSLTSFDIGADFFDTRSRIVNVTTNGVVFDSGRSWAAPTTYLANDAFCVPLKIYGIKNTPVTYPEGGGTTESIEHPGCFYRMVNGVQEWLNPPMELGVEYKTTERYLGKPVYTKAVSCGALPAAQETKIVDHGIVNAYHVIGSYGSTIYEPVGDGGGSQMLPFRWNQGNGVDISCSLSGIRLTNIGTMVWGNYTDTVVCVKYTKTTD